MIEASTKLPEEAATGGAHRRASRFNINSKTLVALDDAGVPDRVIDLMVALTFPKRFVVERAGGSAPSRRLDRAWAGTTRSCRR